MSHDTATLHHRVSGSGDILVLLHGLFGSNENLGGIGRRLQNQFTVHALDLRNHGRSPHTPTHNYPLLAADVAAYIRSITDQPVHLVGHSMGGKTAMRLALDAPELLESLTVIDIAPKPYPRHHDVILAALAALADTPPTSRQEADTRLAQAVSEPSTRQFLLKNLTRDNDGAYQLRLNIEALMTHYDDIANWQDNGSVCPVPALFIVGGKSGYVSRGDRATILKQFPNAKGHVIPGGSHWVHAESPERVSDAISAFIASGGQL